MVGVVLVLAVGTSTAGAQTAPAPAITTDAPQYLPGTTVTYTGTGFQGCSNIKVDVAGPGGSTVATGVTPDASGTFHGTFTALPTVTTYTLVAQMQPPPATGCDANVNFEVVSQLTTTTTTPATSSGSSSSSAAATSTASSSSATAALARTGWNPVLLVAAGVAIAVGLLFVASSRRRSAA
jgi:hypothetical protein